MTIDADVIDTQGSSDGAGAAPPEVAERPSISDIAARAIEVADGRAADREAGREVSAELPNVADLPRERDGRFAPKPAAPKPAPEAASDGRTAEAGSSAQAAPSAAPSPVPAGWSEAKKADFARLQPDAQKLVLQHAAEQDADHDRRTQELTVRARQAEPFLSTYTQHADFLNAQSGRIGVPPNEIMGNLVRVLQQGTTGQPHERAQAAGYVLQLFGIHPAPLLAAQGQPPQARPVDPVAREIASLRQQQAEHGRFIQQVQQDRQQRDVSAAQRSIDDFAAAKGEDGQLLHPHFDAVRERMAPHVERGASFDDAYRIAAKPIEDAVAAAVAARQPRPAPVATVPTAMSGPRPAAAARPGRPGAPRTPVPRSAPPASQDIGGIAWEAMKKVGLAG